MNSNSDKVGTAGVIAFLVLAIVSSFLCGAFVTQAVISPTLPTTLWLAIANGALALVTFTRVLLFLKKTR